MSKMRLDYYQNILKQLNTFTVKAKCKSKVNKKKALWPIAVARIGSKLGQVS